MNHVKPSEIKYAEWKIVLKLIVFVFCDRIMLATYVDRLPQSIKPINILIEYAIIQRSSVVKEYDPKITIPGINSFFKGGVYSIIF